MCLYISMHAHLFSLSANHCLGILVQGKELAESAPAALGVALLHHHCGVGENTSCPDDDKLRTLRRCSNSGMVQLNAGIRRNLHSGK